jgi:hypothetical protein
MNAVIMAKVKKGVDGMLNGKKQIRAGVSCLALLLGCVCNGEAATLGSHYPFGAEGVLAATAPPPGFHYRMYNTWYSPTTLKDNSGNDLPVGLDLNVFASVHRFIHVTDVKILGADFLYDALVPLVDKDVTISASNYSDSHSLAVGDIVLEPFVLSWHKPRWDATAGLAVIVPSGEYNAGELASPGLGYWSGMLTLGATFYLDEKKTWSLSALTRTLVNGEQEDTNVTPGSELVVEYGLGKEIAINNNFLMRPGIAGCAYWQLEDDSDNGPGTLADERKRAYAIGGEINFFYIPMLLQLNLRALHEYGAENTTEGAQFVATLTKSW